MRNGLVTAAFCTAIAVTYSGQAADHGPVYTDPAAADADFAFQGEYLGWQRSQPSPRSSEPYGLQVVALGEGRFAAVKYPGGLPGRGWYRGSRYRLSGERVADLVMLHGDVYDILLERGRATIVTRDGNTAGELIAVRRVSPTMGWPPPPDAVVLFDGREPRHLKGARVSEAGWLEVGTETAAAYRNFRLHAEFLLPYMPAARGQARGNSGLYLQSRYEVQVLDSFGLEGLDNECGGLYKSRAPDVNMCLPPLQWQTYDIDFREPQFDAAGRKTAAARISVWHNGVAIHREVAIPNKTGGGQPEGPAELPIKFQDHGNPVRFRNVWLIETTGSEPWDWPPLPSAPPPLALSRELAGNHPADRGDSARVSGRLVGFPGR